MVLDKELRMMEYWSRFDGSINECIPSLAELQEYKRVGFNAVMIVEINYNRQYTDFKNIILPNPTNNALKTCIEQIKGLGMDAYVLLNPARYGTGTPIYNREHLLYDSVVRQVFLASIQYLVDIGIDGIQLEEPFFTLSTTTQAEVSTFLSECRTKMPSNIMFSANFASAMKIKIENGGVASDGIYYQGTHWTLAEINEGNLVDFVALQPQAEADGSIPNTNLQAYIDVWSGWIPNIPLCLFVYRATYKGMNIYFHQNAEYCCMNNINFQTWPEVRISDADLNQLKTIFDAYPLPEPCPKPQFIFNINQV